MMLQHCFHSIQQWFPQGGNPPTDDYNVHVNSQHQNAHSRCHIFEETLTHFACNLVTRIGLLKQMLNWFRMVTWPLSGDGRS